MPPPRRHLFARLGLIVAAALAMGLAGCASTPAPGRAPGAAPSASPAPHAPVVAAAPAAPPGRDGVPDQVPPDLDKIPDPEPRIEPVRPGGPNKPYAVQGETYEPARGDPEIVERGIASWYGKAFHGRRTASGETYDMFAMTAAHKTMPIPSYARVTNPANGREIVVRINDRGPFVKGRIIDLSYAAATKLGITRGVAPVELSRITHEAIRTGSWRRGGGNPAAVPEEALAQAAPPPSPSVASSSTSSSPVVVPAAAVVSVAATSADEPRPQASPPAPAAPAAPATPASGPSERAPTPFARGFWLQLGAFGQHAGALDFQRKVEQELAALAPLLAVYSDRNLHRLQAGPYPTRGEAQGAAELVRNALKLVPVIVERR